MDPIRNTIRSSTPRLADAARQLQLRVENKNKASRA
jgi:hypothetical protein